MLKVVFNDNRETLGLRNGEKMGKSARPGRWIAFTLLVMQ